MLEGRLLHEEERTGILLKQICNISEESENIRNEMESLVIIGVLIKRCQRLNRIVMTRNCVSIKTSTIFMHSQGTAPATLKKQSR